MSSVRIGRNENGALSATWSDDLQRALGRVDRISAEFAGKFANLKVPNLSAELAAEFAQPKVPSLSASQLDDLFPLAASTCRFLDDEGHREKAQRKQEIETDFQLLVGDPAKAQFASCEISATVLAALIADISNKGGRFGWIGGQSLWRESLRALRDAVAAKVVVSPATLDKVFPDAPESFSLINDGFTNIFPRHEYERLLFDLAVRLVRRGRILVFGERHGQVVHLESSQFQDEYPHARSFLGPSGIERMKMFSALRFIGAKDAVDQYSGRPDPRSQEGRDGEKRACDAILQLAAERPGARMTRGNVLTALKASGFSERAAERVWANAAPLAWKAPGRVTKDAQLLLPNALSAILAPPQ